jgi:glycosyltransferase involved in cell wall biosynthesis
LNALLNSNGKPAPWLVDTRWIGPHGIGRFAKEVFARLPGAEALPQGVSLLSPLEPLWLSSVLWRKRPGVYFSPGFNPPVFSPVPFVFTIHDLNHLQFGDAGAGNGTRMKRAYYRWIMRPACHRAFKVLTGSEFSRREILRWAGVPGESVVNVGYGVDAAFSPGAGKHAPGYRYVLYVGNRKPHKNLRRILEAFAKSGLPEQLKLLLSGDPDSIIVALSHQLGIENRVAFAGPIADSALPGFYRGADALIMPSLYEGFGLPVLEAMACGTPVVTSNVTALPETAGDAAIVVDPRSVAEIAQAMYRVVTECPERQRLIEAGLARAKRFSWESTADRVIEVLRGASAASA